LSRVLEHPTKKATDQRLHRARIGVYGGSFDPVHLGHLRSAIEILRVQKLDELRFLPSGNPPHRSRARVVDKHRLNMLQLAVKDVAGIAIDDRELGRKSVSYSIDTLETIQAENPQAELTLVIGMDQFSAFDTWHRWQELLQRVELTVMERPGEIMSGSAKELMKSSLRNRISIISVTQMDISSSRIRKDLQIGLDIRFLVPSSVRNYILSENLYSHVL